MRVSAINNKSASVKWIATITVFMLNTQIGFIAGWESPNIAWLTSEESPIPMTLSEISWIMSIAMLGLPVGSIIGSILVEYLGSRKTVLITYLISAASWTCLLFANSIEWIYAARFISSLPCATVFCCFSLYLSEVIDPTNRGASISLSQTGMPLGTLTCIAAETYLPKNASTAIYLVEALVGAAIVCWLKDTHYILAKNGDMKGARKSIEFYRANANVKEELDAVRLFVERSEGIADKLEQFRKPSVRKSMLVVCFVFGLMHLSGGGLIGSYMEIIITKAKVDLVKPAECVIYTNIIMIVASFLTFKLTDQLGRRFLLAASGIGTSVSLIALGLHFHLLQLGFDAKTLQWLPIASLAAFFIAFPIGYGSVPGTLLSEMFPESIRSLAACAATLAASFFAFAVTKAYQPIVDAFGDACAFWIFAVFSASGIPCALFLLIETKGKTLQQIQDELHKK